MKKILLITSFVLAFAFTFTFTVQTNAQVTDKAKKVGKVTKKTTVVGVRKTNRGLHKGWTIGKRVGQKTWRKGKGVTVKSYKGTKKTVKKVI